MTSSFSETFSFQVYAWGGWEFIFSSTLMPEFESFYKNDLIYFGRKKFAHSELWEYAQIFTDGNSYVRVMSW